MRVVTDTGSIPLGTTETGIAIGIVDYSRRVTDDFGVTTVVKRNFARRMTANLSVPFADVDAVQQQLAELRATPATWIAEEGFGSFAFRGLYKDFEVNHAVPPLGYCAITIEGIAKEETFVDPGGDPAPEGRSTLRLLDPADVAGGMLVSSTVPEADAPAWSASATYAKGARVILASTHRVYESLIDANIGADPAGTGGKWLDVAPTNRWAMFDQALGTSTFRAGPIEVVLKAGTLVSALALLDTNAATVRVRAPGYDRTQEPNRAGKVLFFDLAVAAGATITITVTPATVTAGDRRWDDGALWMDDTVWRDSQAAGDGTVTIGTMLLGALRDLGVTESSPTSGITDYSRKVVDDFGDVTIVPRAYAKRMAAKAAIRTDAIDLVFERIAAVRAKPCLWLGDEGIDSLTVYGFFRDFEITVDEKVSKLSLSIEGLSTAGKVAPIGGGAVSWPDITDPTGTKPKDNADKTSENTSKDTNAVGGVPAADVTGRLKTLVEVTIPAIDAAGAAAEQRITEARAAADLALSTIESEVERVDQRIDNLSASGGYDDTAVNARITDERQLSLGRDAALGTRIDSVSASITTTDRDLRALVQTKETAAVDRENAISRRVDDLVAQGGGGSEGVDTVARSEIQRVEQAAVLGQQALGSRADLIQATANGASGAINPNQDFRIWPSADAMPTNYFPWSSPAAIARVPNGIQINNNTQEGGIAASIETVTAGWYVYEAEVYLHASATFLNTGLTMNLLKDDGSSTGQYPSHHFYDDVGHGQTDRWYHFSRLVQVPDLPDRRLGKVALHIMGKWNAFGGASSTNNTTWRFARIRPANDAEIKAGKADATLIPAISARVKTTEDTLADLPNRYATAQRAANIEASVGAASGKIASLERVTSDGTLVAAQRADNIEASLNESRATVSQQAGVLAGLNGKTAAYVRLIADAGNGRAALSLWSDQYGGAWQLTGNGAIDGNLTINGTLTARAFNGASMAREASSTWSGPALTPAAGQVISNFWSLGLPPVVPGGRFIYEYTAYVTTNAGTGFNSTYNGKPAYTEYVDDGGGLTLSASDGQGHSYNPRPNASDRNLATVDFAPTFYASIRRGTRDTGFINDGDNYYRQIAATYTVSRIDLKVTWVAI